MMDRHCPLVRLHAEMRMDAFTLDCHPKSFITGMAAISEIVSRFVWKRRREWLQPEATCLSTVSKTKQILSINHSQLILMHRSSAQTSDCGVQTAPPSHKSCLIHVRLHYIPVPEPYFCSLQSCCTVPYNFLYSVRLQSKVPPIEISL